MPQNPQTPQNTNKTLHTSKHFDQGLYDHDVLVDQMHFSEGDKMQISPKLDFSCTNQDQIRNQRPRIRRIGIHYFYV